MTEIIAKIGEISFKNVKVRKFLYEQFMKREYPYDEFIGAWSDRHFDYISTQIALFSPLTLSGETLLVGEHLP